MAQPTVKAAYWLAEKNTEFPAEKINFSVFTHLFCGFATVKPQSKEVAFPSPTDPFTTFSKIAKQHSSNAVKTILSIGGRKSQLDTFASMASNIASRKKFIDSSIALARNNGFEGLDLCWIYPKTETEMKNLGILLAEWKAEITNDAKKRKLPPLLLTAAVNFSPSVPSASTYPIKHVQQNLDWVNVMAYDFTDPTQSTDMTAAPASLEDAKAGVDEWIDSASAQQVVLGLPFFGYAWQLTDPNQHGIRAPADGSYGEDSGFNTYGEIKNLLNQGFSRVYDQAYVTNYCYQGTMWVAYDGSETIKAKVSYARNDKAILGYFAWTVGWDSERCELAEIASAAWP